MNANKDYHLILVDGSSYIYRAFYALPPMTSSTGKPTSVVFGVVNMVRKLIKQYPDSHIAVVFDAPGKNFRHEIYPQYKANRPKMPDEIRTQIAPLHDTIKALGLNLIMIDGVEADDVLGTLAHLYAQKNQSVLISSGDKDLAQLVNHQISVVDTMKNITYDYDEVIKKFGVKPNQIIDYLALVGDSSDNIPGIPKVGAKTAQKWLAEYDSVENIIKNKDKFGGKVGEFLSANIDQLRLSYQLATIDVNIALKNLSEHLNENNELIKKNLDEKSLIQNYRDLSFNSWIVENTNGNSSSLDTHFENQNNAESKNKDEAIVIESLGKLQEYVSKLQENSKLWFLFWLTDQHKKELKIEKYPLNPVIYSLFINNGSLKVLIQFNEALTPNQAIKILLPYFLDSNLIKISTQAKFDLHLLNYYQAKVNHLIDVLVLSWLFDSNGRNDLQTQVQKYLQTQIPNFWSEDEKSFDFSTQDKQTLFYFFAKYSDAAIKLYHYLIAQFEKDENQNNLFKLEQKVLYGLFQMEDFGILLDKKVLKNQGNSLKEQVKKLETQAFDYAGEKFNLASSLQVSQILYDKLQLPVLAKTPAGKPSTAENTLEKISDLHPIAETILNHRLLTKLITTYIDSLPKKVNPNTDRIHTTFNQMGTITGRLSSVEPNLQNIPIRSQEGKKIRQAFIAKKDYVLIAADYSQIELRLMADFSNDSGFIKAFNEGLDIHSATASEVFELPLEKIDGDLRRKAKAVNFGLIYGISAFGLARQLKVEQHLAKGYIDAYFSRYPKVYEFMQNQKIQAKDQGFVESKMARRIYLPDIHSKNFLKRAHAERMAINAPLQSSASDIIKKAMVEIDEWISTLNEEFKNRIKMILQIHDELVFEVHQDYADSAIKKIKEIMQNAYQLKVPLIVNVSKAENLGMVE